MRGISHLSTSRFTGTRVDFVQHCSHSLWVWGRSVLLTVTPLTVVCLMDDVGARKVFYWSANHLSSELNNCTVRHLSGVAISPFTNKTLSFMVFLLWFCCIHVKYKLFPNFSWSMVLSHLYYRAGALERPLRWHTALFSVRGTWDLLISMSQAD